MFEHEDLCLGHSLTAVSPRTGLDHILVAKIFTSTSIDIRIVYQIDRPSTRQPTYHIYYPDQTDERARSGLD